jgi:hypothetical protein
VSSPESRASQQRSAARIAARSNWREGLRLAKNISVKWYRVQSLAEVIMHAPDSEVDDLITTARHYAQSDKEPYKRVAVLAWVAQAAGARGRPRAVEQIVDAVLASLPGLTPLKSRAYAPMQFLDVAAAAISPRDQQRLRDAVLASAGALIASRYPGQRRCGLWFCNQMLRPTASPWMPAADTSLKAQVRAEAKRLAASLPRVINRP